MAGVLVWGWDDGFVLDDVVEVRLLLRLGDDVLPDEVVPRSRVDLVPKDTKLLLLLDHVLHGQVSEELLAQLWVDGQLLLLLFDGRKLDFRTVLHPAVVVHDSHLVVLVGGQSR